MDRQEVGLGILGFSIRLLIFVLVILSLSACADKNLVDLTSRQQEIQDCILSGGHAHLGPDNSIVCER